MKTKSNPKHPKGSPSLFGLNTSNKKCNKPITKCVSNNRNAADNQRKGKPSLPKHGNNKTVNSNNMKHFFTFSFILLATMSACKEPVNAQQSLPTSQQMPQQHIEINPQGNTIKTRFAPPIGFERVEANPNSFAEFLRNLPLKPKDAKVLYYNGKEKPNHGVYAAVVDLHIGTKNLHQCADAVMRLRADYLYQQKRFDDIHFNFTNGFRVDYAKWRQGQRIVVEGNKTYWQQKTNPSTSPETYWQYLEMIFTYAGTLSLSKELKSVAINDLQIGDVLIQGGSPGHAVIVVDKAIHPKTKKWVFMLAQSYMPAQETQVLYNPIKQNSVWFEIPETQEIKTPEWTFYTQDLKRFP